MRCSSLRWLLPEAPQRQEPPRPQLRRRRPLIDLSLMPELDEITQAKKDDTEDPVVT